jgi:hypothetical protein
MRLHRLLHLERHSFGPRVYVLGRRVHEFALGFALLAAGPFGLSQDFHHPRMGGSLAATGLYLVVKDWRDLVPSKRNSSRWSLWPHRRADER